MEFFNQNANLFYVLGGMFFIAIAAAVSGVFLLLQKKSLLGDALSHSILPGIATAFLLSGVKNPIVFLGGSIISAFISLQAIHYLSTKTKLKPDAGIGAVLSFFFAFGMLLLTYIQQSGSGNQSGLGSYIFGNAAALTPNDSVLFAVVALLVVSILIGLKKEYFLIAFNREYAQSIGLPVQRLELIQNILIVVAVASGIQAVGIVLLSALLITPAVIGRFFTHNSNVLLIIAAIASVASAFFGTFISYSYSGMPTGPWIVVFLSALLFVAIIIAPNKGLLARRANRKKFKHKILLENVLKALYKINLNQEKASIETLQAKRAFEPSELKFALKKLENEGALVINGASIQLLDEGIKKGARIVRLHRLWELYLTKRMNLKTDHIHGGAEAIEHILDTNLEQQLIQELGEPELDPHNQKIPYE